MKEQWKPIPGHESYEASSEGRIRSKTRLVRCKGGMRSTKGQVLTPFVAHITGYMQVCIRGRKYSAHRLIALTWCDGHFDGAWVDHIDANRSNNHPSNLEWVTPGENSRRSFKNGRVAPHLGAFSGEHPKSKAVVSTCLKTGKRRVWPAAMDAVKEGYDSSSISRCCHGSYRSHKGHKWQFADGPAA